MNDPLSSNVHQLFVKPKQVTRHYKQHKYTVTYVPATKKWKWTVETTQVVVYSEEADNQVKAFRAAEKHIDRVLVLQGKAG